MLLYFWYILKVIICSGLLFGYYWLFLRNKVFHQYNRFYLLAALTLSLVLPLLKINFWQANETQSEMIRALQVVSAGDEYMNNVIVTADQGNWSIQQLYPLVYWMVSLIFLLVMLQTVFIIRSLLKKYPVQLIDDISFINTNDKSTPFSFLKYIFWNDGIDLDTATGKQIFKHEVAHIQEKHTYDKLFINILLIFFWCNPFFWLYRKELNMIHEFIADKKAVEDSDTASFAAMILQAAYPQHRFQLTNNFFYSPIKRRLLMLTKNNNPRVNYLGRVMVLPLAVLIFAAFTFKTKTSSHIYNGKKITVVIDAGHGGQDAGVKSADGILEKDLTLVIAKKIKELNSNDAIEIILTKETDVFLNKQQKIEFTKSQNPLLYITLHADKGAENKSGLRVLIAKDGFPYSNQSQMLGSAILNEFIENYGLPVSQQLVQHHLLTLEQNPCPSVYIETGLISNQKDLNYLQSEKGKETIAKNVLTAIEKFASSITQSKVLQNKSSDNIKSPTDTVPNKHSTAPLTSNIQPLFILDGVEADSNVLRTLDPNRISSINVLKDESAFAKYGERGNNGVIEITLKKNEQPQVAILAKFSVLYIGIDNPITIAAPGISSDQLLVSMNTNNGTIIGRNGKYIVRATAVGEATITVSTIKNDQRVILSAQTFQIKRIPDPTDPNFPDELKGLYKLDSSYKLQYYNNQKLLEEQKYLSKLDQTQSRIQAINAASDAEKTVKEKKIQEQQLQLLKQKIILDEQNKTNLVTTNLALQKIQLDQKGLLAQQNNLVVEKAMMEKNLTDQELHYLKQKIILDEQNKTNLVTTNLALQKIQLDQKEFLVQQDNLVSTKAEASPQFTGGEEAWKKYLRANLNNNTPVDNRAPAGKYTVVLKFIVRTDGSISDVTCENDPGFGTCAEALRVIKITPKWQPAIQNGKKVNAWKRQPITWLVEE